MNYTMLGGKKYSISSVLILPLSEKANAAFTHSGSSCSWGPNNNICFPSPLHHKNWDKKCFFGCEIILEAAAAKAS